MMCTRVRFHPSTFEDGTVARRRVPPRCRAGVSFHRVRPGTIRVVNAESVLVYLVFRLRPAPALLFDRSTGGVLWKLAISSVGGSQVRSERHPVHCVDPGLVELSGQSDERRDSLPGAGVRLLVAAQHPQGVGVVKEPVIGTVPSLGCDAQLQGRRGLEVAVPVGVFAPRGDDDDWCSSRPRGPLPRRAPGATRRTRIICQ